MNDTAVEDAAVLGAERDHHLPAGVQTQARANMWGVRTGWVLQLDKTGLHVLCYKTKQKKIRKRCWK